MTISLGGIALPDGTGQNGKIAWTDQDAYSPIAAQVQQTIAGRLHYAQAVLEGGRPITLEALEGECWLSEAQKDALIALAAVPGVKTFIHGAETHDCIFDHESGAVSFRRKRPTSDVYWYGTIRLLTTS